MWPFYVRKTNFFAHKMFFDHNPFRFYAMQVLYTVFASWKGDSKVAVLVFGRGCIHGFHISLFLPFFCIKRGSRYNLSMPALFQSNL